MALKSIKYFTLKYLVLAILMIIAIWTALFYAYLSDEIYDNVDDSLKSSKINIIRESYKNPEILKINEFGINQFRITPINSNRIDKTNYIFNDELYSEYEESEEPVRMLKTEFYDQFGNTHQLEIYTSTVEQEELVEQLVLSLIFLSIALVLNLLIINHFILKKAWRPFYKILQELQLYKVGHKNSKINTHTDVKEFVELNQEINKMIDRNEVIYAQQKLFIENASHELQTPLAIISNRLDTLLQHPELDEYSITEIHEITQKLNRISKLNKSLLTLSKIENNQYLDNKWINFNTATDSLLEELEDLILHKNINIEKINQGDFIFEMDEYLAKTLIMNLLKNAIIYSPKDSTIEILIDPNHYQVKNKSSQNQPLDSGKIFQRFFKDSQNEHSTGLGLAIVQSIVNLYEGLQINYFYQNQHIFEIEK